MTLMMVFACISCIHVLYNLECGSCYKSLCSQFPTKIMESLFELQPNVEFRITKI